MEWDEPTINDTPEPTVEHYQQLGEAFRDVLEWITEGDQTGRDYGKSVKNRVLAAVWVMRPELLDDRSLTELCKNPGLGASKWTISKHAARFSERFGIRAINQRKDHTANQGKAVKRHVRIKKSKKRKNQLELPF